MNTVMKVENLILKIEGQVQNNEVPDTLDVLLALQSIRRSAESEHNFISNVHRNIEVYLSGD